MFYKVYNKILHPQRLLVLGEAIAAAGINMLGTTLGGISSYHKAKKILSRQQEWNEKMYGIQLADNRENWKMQNEYNSPANQRKLLEEGGFNPALMGSDLSAASSADAIQGADAPSAPSFTNMPNILGDAVSSATQMFMALQNADTNRMNAETNSSNSQTNTEFYRNYGYLMRENIELLSKENVFKSEMLQEQLNSLRAKNAATELQIDAQTILNKTLPTEKALQLGNLAAQYDYILEQTKSERISQKEAKARISEIGVSVKKMLAETNQLNQLTPYLVEQNRMKAEHLRLGVADDFNTKERLAPVSVGFNVSGGPFKGGANVTLPLKGMAQDGTDFIRKIMRQFQDNDDEVDATSSAAPVLRGDMP